MRLNARSGALARLTALSAFTCSGCGAVLPESDQGEALLRKLLQLSRFGLCAGASPLLESKRLGQ